jgi:hypothetical protein
MVPGAPRIVAGAPCAGPRRAHHGQLHGVPLTLKLVGVASLMAHVPWKPNDWLPPAGMAES